MKVCNFCGNKNFKSVEVEYTYKRNNKMLIINNVPCEKCEYCGEEYFKADVLKKVEYEFNSIYSQGKKVKTEYIIPVEQFAEIQDQR